MKEIITILGNSLAIKRPDEGCSFKDTYTYKLDCHLGKNFFIVNNSKRANTVVRQVGSVVDDAIQESKYFIIQLGIVECFPRIFHDAERQFISRLPKVIREAILSFTSKRCYFFTKHFPKVYVKKSLFKDKYIQLIEYLLKNTQVQKIFLINIVSTNDYATQRRYNVWKNIEEYNQIITDVAHLYPDQVEVINLFQITKEQPDFVLGDGVHINNTCHGVLAGILSEKITLLETMRGAS